jgi:DNA-directed RNA polymerase beta subunit
VGGDCSVVQEFVLSIVRPRTMDFDDDAATNAAFPEIEINDSTPISQVDAWVVIQSYFDEKGLVRQQLDSFDQFITNTILEVVEDTQVLAIKPTPQYGTVSTTSEVRELAWTAECTALSICYLAAPV